MTAPDSTILRYDDAALERIARHYCERLGLDPDLPVAHGADPDKGGFAPDGLLYSPRWQRALREIKPTLELLLALEDLRSTPWPR